jgi:hypothetical protein
LTGTNRIVASACDPRGARRVDIHDTRRPAMRLP